MKMQRGRSQGFHHVIFSSLKLETAEVHQQSCSVARHTQSHTDIAGNDGEIVSVLDLTAYADKISCYVRCQLKGDGGICMSQPVTLDAGNFADLAKPIPPKKVLTKKEQRKENFNNTRLGVIVNKIKNK